MNINALQPAIGTVPRVAPRQPVAGHAVSETYAPRPAAPVERVIEGELLRVRRADAENDAAKRLLLQRSALGEDEDRLPMQARAAIASYVSTGAVPAPPQAERAGGLDVYV